MLKAAARSGFVSWSASNELRGVTRGKTLPVSTGGDNTIPAESTSYKVIIKFHNTCKSTLGTLKYLQTQRCISLILF